MVIWLSVPSTHLISISVCLLFDTYPVWRLYTALLRFSPSNPGVSWSALCGVDVCWSSLDTHWPLMWLWSSCSSPNLALDLSHTFWWRCNPVSECSMATFSYEDWVPLSDTVPYFWVQCLFQAFNEVKRLYAALLRFIHLSLVYRGLRCVV